MTLNDKIERAFQALKQAITAASVIVGEAETDIQRDAVLSVNRMMDEVEYVLNLPEIKDATGRYESAEKIRRRINSAKEEK